MQARTRGHRRARGTSAHRWKTDGVKRDFEMYGPLVNPAGLIAFHDIDYSRDVRRFWDEIKVGRRFQEIRDDHGQTFGIGLIYN